MTPGRRDNGLAASDWGALVDLDPRLAESLLDRLAAAQVPAYVEPASATDTYARAGLPSRPLDRLFVDPAHAQQARDVVTAEVADLAALLAEDADATSVAGLVQPVPKYAARRVLPPPQLPEPRPTPPAAEAPADAPSPSPAPAPAPAPRDDDELFRQIVAGWDRTGEDPVPRWSPSEDDGPRRAPAPEAAPPRRARREPADALPDWVEPEALDRTDRDLDPGHYVPPPPPPAPRVQPRTAGAVVALVLGLVLVFLPELVGQAPSPGVLLLGAVLLGGGAGALVYWLRDARGDDGPGDGAVV